ncbi:hypothetical protein [Falsiroseomonas sp. HW251]|uniref:hypothetical protein n=1 Tax=Falsiroseomonas sp. HW251 TaxID=3390998 RepID=UPI003D3195E6
MNEVPLDRPADVAALRCRAAEMPPHPAPPTREERMRRDPLPFIPEARRAAARAPAREPEAGAFELSADDPAWRGQGWWPLERTQSGPLRWTGPASCAAVLLPALGGGALRVTLNVRAPFGIPLDIARYELELDGAPLSFGTLANDGVTGRFSALVTIAPMPPLTRVALLIAGAWHEDPDTGPRRELRKLGLGLMRVRLERA